MAVGLGVLGVAGYLFLLVVGRGLPVDDALAVTMLYLIMNTIGPGVFSGLEQETTRSVSSTLAAGQPVLPVLRRAARAAAWLLVTTGALVMVMSPILVDRLLNRRWELIGTVLLCVVVSALAYLVRGLLAGSQRFGAYGMSLMVEGLVRVLPCIALVVLGLPNAFLFALFCVSAPLASALAGAGWLWYQRRKAGTLAVNGGGQVRQSSADAGVGEPGPVVAEAATVKADLTRFVVKGMLLVVAASILTQFVQNVVPMVVKARLNGDVATGLTFADAFVLVRSPLMLFVPVQAMLLPALSAALTRGDMPFVRRRLGLITKAILVVGLASTVGFVVAGNWALGLYKAPKDIEVVTMVLMCLGTMIMMFVNTLQPALVAFGRQTHFFVGWVAGTVVLCACLVLPFDPVGCALVALLAGPSVVLVVMLSGLRTGIRARSAESIQVEPSESGRVAAAPAAEPELLAEPLSGM